MQKFKVVLVTFDLDKAAALLGFVDRSSLYKRIGGWHEKKSKVLVNKKRIDSWAIWFKVEVNSDTLSPESFNPGLSYDEGESISVTKE